MHGSNRRRLVALLAGAALVAAACGSDDNTSTDTTAATEAATDTSAAPADTAATATEPAGTAPADTEATGSEPAGTEAPADDPLGTPTAATGDPVKIGLITESGGEAISSQSQLTETGAQIAVDYVNEYRGGLAGQPIELVICGNKASASGASDCANQMVEQDVAAVVWPFTGFGPQQVPIITGAGIPIIAVSGSSTEELTTPGVFIITGGYVGTLGAYAQHSADNAVEKFSMITIDVPSATQAAEGIGSMVFGNAGVDYSVVKVAPGTPDMTAQVQAAISDGATALGVTGDVTFCTSFFQAYQALALDVPKYIIQPCVDPTVIDSLSDVLDGSILATTVATDEDTDVYAAMVDKYGDGDRRPEPGDQRRSVVGRRHHHEPLESDGRCRRPDHGDGRHRSGEDGHRHPDVAVGRADLHLQRDGDPDPAQPVLGAVPDRHRRRHRRRQRTRTRRRLGPVHHRLIPPNGHV